VDNGQKLQGKQIIKSSKSKMAAVCYGPNFLLKYLITFFRPLFSLLQPCMGNEEGGYNLRNPSFTTSHLVATEGTESE